MFCTLHILYYIIQRNKRLNQRLLKIEHYKGKRKTKETWTDGQHHEVQTSFRKKNNITASLLDMGLTVDNFTNLLLDLCKSNEDRYQMKRILLFFRKRLKQQSKNKRKTRQSEFIL